MPIEFRSGLPGAGKTLGAVEHMLQLRKKSPERPVYCLGVTDLRDGIAIPLDEAGLKGWEDLPAGAIVVVDECQKYMPARRGAAESPQWVKNLSTHRHLGLDFIFISQHASLIDPYVRKLVSRHIHTVRVFGTQMVERWEWPEIQSDPTSANAKKTSESKTRHTYSREAMQCYKSAELHTVSTRVPKFLKLGVLALVALPILGYGGYLAMHHATTRGGSEAKADDKTGDAKHPFMGGSQNPVDAMRQEDYAKWVRPRVDGVPWSAPAFDHLEVKAVPQVFCVASDDLRCVCHTEQGTRYAMKAVACREIAANGMYNPFIDGTAGSGGDSRQSASSDANQGQGGGSVAPAQRGLPAGAFPGGDEGSSMHERATAAAYTPPEYHAWNADPFGAGGGKGP